MITQKITRLSIYGSNAEYCEMAPNVWVVVFHNIDTELRGSMYAGTKICTCEEHAWEEAKAWLDNRNEYNEEDEVL